MAPKVGGKRPGWDSLAGGLLMAMMPFVVTWMKPSVVRENADMASSSAGMSTLLQNAVTGARVK
jgi:hypothetical protein